MKYGLALYRLLICIMLIQVARAQVNPQLEKGDSLYLNKKYADAKMIYSRYLVDHSGDAMVWNRLGFCNQNLGLYEEALGDYQKSLASHPIPPVKSSAESRTAMIYSIQNKTDASAEWLVKATMSGYNSLNDLDSLPAFEHLRTSAGFAETRKKIFEAVFPCSREPHNRDFDFWIGDWACYRTGTQILSGYSHVEAMAGGCAILENYTATQAYTGKSFNFYDTVAGKWEQDWIGSGGASDRQRFYNGEFKNGTMHFTYESRDAAGAKIQGNFIFYFISKDSVRQYQDVMDDAGKIKSVTYDLTYIRSGKRNN